MTAGPCTAAGTPRRGSWRWRSRRPWTLCCPPGTRRRPRSTRSPATPCSRTSLRLAPMQVPAAHLPLQSVQRWIWVMSSVRMLPSHDALRAEGVTVSDGLQAWGCCRSTAAPGSHWPGCRWRPRPQPTWTARAHARQPRRRASVAANTCWLPSRSSGTWPTGAAAAQMNSEPTHQPHTHVSLSLTTTRPDRPGWSESASGRQLTADLCFKRSVAAIDSGLGARASAHAPMAGFTSAVLIIACAS